MLLNRLRGKSEFGYSVYVDGSPGPKVGGRPGWGLAMLVGETPVYVACGGYDGVVMTNNEAEIEAVAHGMSLIHRLNLPVSVTLWTDSQYVAGSIPKLHRYYSSGWNDEKGKPVKNADRLALLHTYLFDLELAERCVVRFTKGHKGTIGNELADRLAHQASYEGKAYYEEP